MGILVTGGAGFIGSHLADKLAESGYSISIADNLSSGKKENIPAPARFSNTNLSKSPIELPRCDTVFHFAADPDVQTSFAAPDSSFRNNLVATANLLEWARKNDVESLIFASTSAVYGETKQIPTPEDCPSLPISNYAASKTACEAYLHSYSCNYGIKSTCLRFANIFGKRSLHGIIPDLFFKLKKDKNSLEILGDGEQKKSYLYIADAVDASIACWKSQKQKFEAFNIGSEKQHSADEIAQLICREIGVSPALRHSGGKRGWKGDVPNMLLDISKLKETGWKQRFSFEEGLSRYLHWLEGLDA